MNNTFSYEPKTDESMLNIPKGFVKKLINEHKAKDKFNENKIKKLEEKLSTHNEKEKIGPITENTTVSSIFKKKENIDKDENPKSEKHISFHNDAKQDSATNKTDSNTSNESSSDETSSSEEESSSSGSDSDEFHMVATEDEINEAYRKINKEMSYIRRRQKEGTMKKSKAIKRINFLLNGLRILDNIGKYK